MKKFGLLLFTPLLALILVSNFPVHGETSTSSPTLKQQIKEDRIQLRAGIKDLRQDTKASMSALKEEFRQKLLTIRNQKKQQILEKLAEKMDRVNQRRVEHWKKVLARLTEILNRIKATNKHTTDLDAAVANADSKLAAAVAAVDAQGEKRYTINIASESGLKTTAGSAISGEMVDLRNVLKSVNDARQAVFTALMTLKKNFGGPPPKLATPSGTPATSSGSATSSATTQ